MPAVHGLRDLYRRREDWPRVIQTLELEVKLWTDDKERAGVFAQIGRINEQWLGDPERAMQYYESALAVDPDCVPANQALFEHYFAVRDWAQAAEVREPATTATETLDNVRCMGRLIAVKQSQCRGGEPGSFVLRPPWRRPQLQAPCRRLRRQPPRRSL